MDGLVFSYPQMAVTIFIDSNDFHNAYLKSGIFVYNHNVLVFMMIIIIMVSTRTCTCTVMFMSIFHLRGIENY